MRSEAVMRAPRLRVVHRDQVPPAVAKAKAERSARRVVVTLSFSVAALTVLGLVMVLSASSVTAFSQYGSSFLFFKRQLLFAAIGATGATVAARIRYQVWQKAWLPLLAVTLVLLALVLSIGRWPAGRPGGSTFAPSPSSRRSSPSSWSWWPPLRSCPGT